MKDTVQFHESAQAALNILHALVSLGERQTRKDKIPSVLELQTICREAGCDFADLNVFARVRDERPALLLCGGDSTMARDVAAMIGCKHEFQELPDAPLAWIVDHGSSARISLRHGDTERKITKKVLTSFFQNELKLDEFVFIDETIKGSARWKFIWVPFPEHLMTHLGKPSTGEILVSQRASLVVTEDTPEPIRQLLKNLEQLRWTTTLAEWDETGFREVLTSALTALVDEPEERLDERATFLWQFVSERLVDQIDSAKRSYQIQIEQQEHKIRFLRQLLSQYHKSWTNGVRNLVDAHFQQRLSGRAFTAFYDVRQAGPDISSFLSAAALQALFTKVEHFVTDRMAEFAGSLEGMAVRLELHRITFGEMNVRWSPKAIAPKLEAILNEKSVFPDGGEKRSGIVAKVTGKASAMIEQRKSQITQACREVSRMITADYSEWCVGFTNAFEQNVRVQLAASLANQGLPDVEGLRSAMEGFDRLSHRIQHYEESARSSEIVAGEWLRQLSARRWIPLYHTR